MQKKFWKSHRIQNTSLIMRRERDIINRLNVEHQNNENVNINHHIETNMIVNMNEIPIGRKITSK